MISIIMSRRKKVRKEERGRKKGEILIGNCIACFMETELSGTSTQKRDEMEESNDEQEKEGKETG